MWTVRKFSMFGGPFGGPFESSKFGEDCSVFRFRISIRIILVQVCLWIFKVLFGLGLDSHFLFSSGFCLDLFGLSLNSISQCVSLCFKELPLSSAAAFVRHETVRVALALTSLNTLEVRTGDLENAFLMLS